MSRDYMGKSEIESERRAALADDDVSHEGIDFALMQLCRFLNIDPNEVTWDAATETIDGDVMAVIGNIFRTKFGEDWSPSDPRSSEPTSAWQPIETAPRDGRRLLGTGGGLDDTVEVISYNGRVGAWDTENYTLDDRDDEAEGYNRPSHWQPMPSAHVSSPKEGGQ